MKKMFTMLFAAMVALTAIAQDFVPKTAVMPQVFSGGTLDATKDVNVYTRAYTKDIAVWTGDVVENVVAKFDVSYTADSLFIYSELRLETTTVTGQDEISMTISLDPDRAAYSFDLGEPNDNGFLFSKITFGGAGSSAAVAGVAKVRRNVKWIYEEVADVEVEVEGFPVILSGYNVEARVAWNDISTNQTLIDNFKADYRSGQGTIYFDVAYKFNAAANYVAWSNDDNTAWESSMKLGVLTLAERKDVNILSTTATLELDADNLEGIYTGEGHDVNNWTNGVVGIEGVSAKYWSAYDEVNLYLYSQVVVPDAAKTVGVDEVTVTVGVRPTDAHLSYDDGASNENGFLFSKLKFGAAGSEELTAYTNRGVEWIWRAAQSFDEFEGYILEAKIPWSVASTDPAMVAAFKERKSLFFDLGFKLAGLDANYFAWNNRDNLAWRSTFSTGRLLLEGYTPPTSVKRIDAANSDISIWPNPVNNVLNIQSATSLQSVEVFNLSGQKVLQVNVLNGSSIDVSSLNAGVYLVKVNFADGNSGLTKIIKQ